MSHEQNLEQLRANLQSHGQEHLLAWWPELDETQRAQLFEQIQAVDFDVIRGLLDEDSQHAGSEEDSPAARAGRAKPPHELVQLPQTDADRAHLEEARSAGLEALRAGRVAAVLVAGGQGTRLGFPHPKGMFPIGPVSQSTLFQIFVEQLRARAARAETTIPYYVMTSDATHEETVAFFKQHSGFGLEPNDLRFFKQGNMPAVDRDSGRILMASRHELCLSPDGHGGILAALDRSGCLDDMKQRGIDLLFYHQVDNPTAPVCDPTMIGLHLLHRAQVSTKVVRKVSPTERMGVVVDVDGTTQIIEYSDLPEELADRRTESGEPIFWAGSTAIHVFNREFLEELARGDHRLPFHLARKNVPHIDTDGALVEPSDPANPNAIKFEQFIFDTLPLAETALVVEAERSAEFNPVKNAEGSDSPETARSALIALHRSWLEQAGANVAESAVVEISPLFALDPADLEGTGLRGTTIDGQLYLGPAET